MTFDALLANLRHASTKWWKVNKNKKNSLNLVVVLYCWSFTVILLYIVLLNKLRLDQISCSGSGGTR